MSTIQTFLVGGAVRDLILGIQPKDFDYVVIGADVQYMIDNGFRQVGASFPVFLHPETGAEYALARREKKVALGYTGFEFEFGPHVTLEDDLFRRDLTINSIAYNLDTKEFIDPYQGIVDLENKVLRHTSEAFSEDPLRVLRISRFVARYNFTIAPETVKLCSEIVNSGEIDALSADRVWGELDKLMSEKYSSIGLQFLSRIDALQKVKRLNGLVRNLPINYKSIYKHDIEPTLTIQEKRFMNLKIQDLTKEQAELFRVPSCVVRECKFMHRIYRLIDLGTLTSEPQFIDIIKTFDAHRDEIKSGQLQMVIDLVNKRIQQHDYFSSKKFLQRLNTAFSALLKLNFTEWVKELKPSEIKNFVLEKKIEIIKQAFINE